MKNHSSPLAARVAAVNLANTVALDYAPKLRAALTPFFGRKVIKTDGSLLQAVAEIVPSGNTYGNNVQIFRDSWSNYSLYWIVKTWEQCNGCAYYHGTSVYVGNLEGQILREWNGADSLAGLRTDWTTEEIEQKRVAAEKAKEIARNAESACFPFGMFDR